MINTKIDDEIPPEATTKKEPRSDYKTIEQKIEATIQKALHRNMIPMIVVIGVFHILLKIIDKF